MNVAIIGAGFSGLSAAYRLQQLGHTVHVFERMSEPGGLALGFQVPGWDWTLEEHYHHWFTNDAAILTLARDTDYQVLIRRPKTSIYTDKGIFQFDSPKAVLSFPYLTAFEKVRMASTLGILKINPFWKPLEKYRASEILPRFMGRRSYEMIWEPQFTNKFGSYTSDISLAWFWARITKRTPDLAYPEKGFLAFAKHVDSVICDRKGMTMYNTEILDIKQLRDKKIEITYDSNGRKKRLQFDKAIVTLPTFSLTTIAKTLPSSYLQSLSRLNGLGAINLVLRLKRSLLSNNTYWLSICKSKAPVMAVVEHTHFMNRKHYNNEHIVYVGNYLPADHHYFSFTAPQLLDEYEPFLKEFHQNIKKDLIGVHVFKAPFAQPIIPINYSRLVPSHRTPWPNLLLANMQQVYPWDRGTNYAVEIGIKAAEIINSEQ